MIFIVVKFTIRPDRVEEFPELVAEFTKAVRAEPGNLFFEWSRSLDTPETYVLVEGFASEAAGGEHVDSDHFRKAMAWMPSVVATTPEIINVETSAEGWSAMAEITPV